MTPCCERMRELPGGSMCPNHGMRRNKTAGQSPHIRYRQRPTTPGAAHDAPRAERYASIAKRITDTEADEMLGGLLRALKALT